MNKPKFKEKSDVPVGQLPNVPKVPIPVAGYVIYSQVALDFKKRYKLGKERQTALNLAIAKAILNGKLCSYDVGTGLPCEPGELSPYVRPDHIETWLKSIGYPLKWSGAPAAEGCNRGSGSEKMWDDAEVEKLIQRRKELMAQGIKNWATQAAKEFGVSDSLARKVIREYKKRTLGRKDPSTWQKKR
jgi:hypothetical protein